MIFGTRAKVNSQVLDIVIEAGRGKGGITIKEGLGNVAFGIMNAENLGFANIDRETQTS